MPQKRIQVMVDGMLLDETIGQDVFLFDRDEVGFPGALLVKVDDLLWIRSQAAVAGLTIHVRARLLLANGEVIPLDYTHTPAANRTLVTTFANMADGFLLSLVVDLAGGSARRGQCFVAVGLNRGGSGAFVPATTLVSGYPSNVAPLSWPAGGITGTLDGAGSLQSLQNAAPAAGADFVITVPAGARWRVSSLRTTLTTAVAAANRIPHIVIDDGANILFEAAALEAQAASLTNTWVAAADGISQVVEDAVHHLALPTVLDLLQGWRIRSVTTAIQAADQWAIQNVLVQEWQEP
jgi:hypothetical protein